RSKQLIISNAVYDEAQSARAAGVRIGVANAAARVSRVPVGTDVEAGAHGSTGARRLLAGIGALGVVRAFVSLAAGAGRTASLRAFIVKDHRTQGDDQVGPI